MGIFTSKSQAANLPAFTYKNMIKYNTTSSIYNEYEMLDLLGQGSFAEVRKARSKRSGVTRAIKIIDRKKHAKIQPLLLNQFDILKQMDHPNILKIYEIYEEIGYYYIVSEFCFGRELFDILRQKKQLNQYQTAEIFYQLCSAVQYLHSKGVMHRDLKPENIMYDSGTNVLKLIDFGSALRYQTNQPIQKRRVGTSYYIAPEVIDRCYNNKCDIWSLGIILFVLLSGDAPFKGKNDDEVLQNIKKGQYNFLKNPWDVLSSQAKILITDLLVQNPSKRLTIDQIMQSDWIKKYKKKSRVLFCNDKIGISNALSNMQKFKETKSNNIEGAMLVFMVNFVRNADEQAQMQKVFKQLDINGDGILSLEQLTMGLQKFLKIGNKQATKIAQTIFKRVDTNNSGFIDYSQFIVAANNIELAATQQNLQLTFDCLDQDKNGSVSAQELRSRLGDNIPIESYEDMLRMHVPNFKGEINKKCFVSMMKNLIKKQ